MTDDEWFRLRELDVKMTFRDVYGVVHFVHATYTSQIEKVCGGKTTYLPHEISNSDTDPPTCFWCVIPTLRWKRPPFGPDDPRGQRL